MPDERTDSVELGADAGGLGADAVGPDHTMVMGGGRFQQFAGEWLVRHPDRFFYAANFGTVGYALSGAIGAALARSERQVLCCPGDGDFTMHCQELETAVRAGAAPEQGRGTMRGRGSKRRAAGCRS